MEIETTIERHDGAYKVTIPIVVEYFFHKGSRGARDSIGGKPRTGPPLEPDEPPSIEIGNVSDANTGHDIELTRAEEERIMEECREDYDVI